MKRFFFLWLVALALVVLALGGWAVDGARAAARVATAAA
jgi:hypothetical protein